MAGDDRGSRIAREMVRTCRGGPAVLLLSATPYRLYGGDLDHWFGEDRHHEQFFDLVEWLFGNDCGAQSRRRELECLFRKYGDALRSADPGGATTRAMKAKIEERLRMIIARTERLGHEAGQDAAKPIDVPTSPEHGRLADFSPHGGMLQERCRRSSQRCRAPPWRTGPACPSRCKPWVRTTRLGGPPSGRSPRRERYASRETTSTTSVDRQCGPIPGCGPCASGFSPRSWPCHGWRRQCRGGRWVAGGLVPPRKRFCCSADSVRCRAPWRADEL